MSRTIKGTGMRGFCGNGGMKIWKQSANQCYRSTIRTKLANINEDFLLPKPREISNIWDSPCDGKHFEINKPLDLKKIRFLKRRVSRLARESNFYPMAIKK